MSIRLLIMALFTLTLFACSDDDDFPEIINSNKPEDVTGLNFVDAQNADFATIYGNVTSALGANAAISIVAEVDHRGNAATVNAELRPTRVVLFGNPNLGTPLMQINPQAGLDLPQKMLVYQPDDEDIIIAYNSVEYLTNRHGVGDAATIGQIRDALANLASTAGSAEVESADEGDVSRNEGVTSFTGPGTVDSVYTRLRDALQANSSISIVAELDHQANAASVNMELPPIRLIVFGNPALGTPLLQDEQSVGIDLPQKMLVYESGAGEVTVAFNDPFYIADRHDVDDDLGELTTIREALTSLAQGALGQ